MKNKSKVVARLTAIGKAGTRIIVEVHEDATFSSFFKFYTQQGAHRITKQLVRVANRNEGLAPWHRAYRMQPGLEAIAQTLKTRSQFTSVKIRIIKRRIYRKLLAAAPDALGLVKVTRLIDRRMLPTPILRYPNPFNFIPEGHTTIKKKWSILLGRSR